MGFYDADIAAAKEAIAEFGQEVIWRKLPKTQSVSEPWKSVVGVPVDHKVNIVFLPVDRVGTALFKSMTGTEIITGSIYGLMGAVPFVVEVTDVVIRDGEQLRITSIDPLAPNGQHILYTIQFET